MLFAGSERQKRRRSQRSYRLTFRSASGRAHCYAPHCGAQIVEWSEQYGQGKFRLHPRRLGKPITPLTA
jgi:hypothetical protein